MKKAMRWIVVVLILSGWVAFFMGFSVSMKEKAQLNSRIAQLESEIGSYQFLVSDVDKSSEKIDGIISTLENLKNNLDTLKSKMDKGVNHESSQDGK
ncbi:MAG TPA: hypothetical protein PKN36_04170 [bacterium]|nr:hypothetical protein [bacterium]